jgi:hypothetical protein
VLEATAGFRVCGMLSAVGPPRLITNVGLHSHVMRKLKNILLLSIALIGLLGCAQTQTHRAWSSGDSWYHPPDEWSRFRQVQSLPISDIVEVMPDQLAAAEEQLRDVAWVEVSSQRAADLTGHRIEARVGSSLFLVRAVYLNRATGRFEVVLAGRELLVEHSSLGHSAVPMKHLALVLRLPVKPEVVYVSCAMDE